MPGKEAEEDEGEGKDEDEDDEGEAEEEEEEEMYECIGVVVSSCIVIDVAVPLLAIVPFFGETFSS